MLLFIATVYRQDIQKIILVYKEIYTLELRGHRSYVQRHLEGRMCSNTGD